MGGGGWVLVSEILVSVEASGGVGQGASGHYTCLWEDLL